MPRAKQLAWILALGVGFVFLEILSTKIGPLIASWRLGPKVEEHPVASIKGWGEVFDPAGDCTIKGDGSTLSIQVPGTVHDLSVEHAQISAPRVLRKTHGDFVAEVTVANLNPPGDRRISSYALPFHGAGLLIWVDRDDYVRLERATVLRNNQDFHYVNFERRSHAVHVASSGLEVPMGEISLRIERRGSQVRASYRVEGQDWVELPKSLGVDAREDSHQVGVAAVNVAGAPLTAELKDFRIDPRGD